MKTADPMASEPDRGRSALDTALNRLELEDTPGAEADTSHTDHTAFSSNPW